MIYKMNNIGFLLSLMVFYVSTSIMFSISIENQITLNSRFKKDIFLKNNYKNTGNFILIDEKLDNFNKFLDNIITLNIQNFLEKSLEKEITRNQKIYFDNNYLDNSVLTQIKNNETTNNNTIILNITDKEEDRNKFYNKNETNLNLIVSNKTHKLDSSINKTDAIPNINNKTLADKVKNMNEISNNHTVKKTEEKKEPKEEINDGKSDFEKIKNGSDDLKDKTNKILDKLKDLDERQTKIITELKGSLRESNELSYKNIDSVKDRTIKLENELELQKNNANDIKYLYNQTKNLSTRLENVNDKANEISENLTNIINEIRNMKFKIISDKIDSDNKMVIINKKLTQQLRLMYSNQILQAQKQAEDIEKYLKENNSKIKLIKARLPETDNLCSLLTNCGSCTSNPNCGWCSMSQECVPGTKDGPSNGQCSIFDYGSCGGPRDCGSYDNCGDCLKDISCGWCNSTGNQKCIDKNSAEQGNCSQQLFIHLWKSLNICPHDKNLRKQSSFDGTDNSIQSLKKKDITKIFLIDPLMKKRLIEELKFYSKEVSENEVKLKNIISSIRDLKKELLKLDQNPNSSDDYMGLAKQVEKTEEEINKEYLKKAKEKENVIKAGDSVIKELNEKDQSNLSKKGIQLKEAKKNIKNHDTSPQILKNEKSIINKSLVNDNTIINNNKTNITNNFTILEKDSDPYEKEVFSTNVTSNLSLNFNIGNKSNEENQNLNNNLTRITNKTLEEDKPDIIKFNNISMSTNNTSITNSSENKILSNQTAIIYDATNTTYSNYNDTSFTNSTNFNNVQLRNNNNTNSDNINQNTTNNNTIHPPKNTTSLLELNTAHSEIKSNLRAKTSIII